VIRRLQADGYRVVAPANPLRGVVADTAYLRSVVDAIEGPVVLVGHSYAGALIGNLPGESSHIQALVYIAAYLPEVGETITQTNAGSKDVLLGPKNLQTHSYPLTAGGTGTEATARAGDFRTIMAGDLPPSTAQELAAAQRPFSTTAFSEPITEAAWKRTPSWCVIPTHDHAIGADAERAMAVRAHCHIRELDGSHLVMIASPDRVADVIEEAARATTRARG
jgi:pimeloyl-ACP methyl ester carboxylesterase